MHTWRSPLALTIGCLAFVPVVLAQPTVDPLSSLLPASDWAPAIEGLGFADGLSNDAAGNIYFSDMKAKAVYRFAPDGTKTKLLDFGPSGTRLGPDGKLYTVGGGKCIAWDLATAKDTLLAADLKTNDLVTTVAGFLYLTETAKKQITFIDPKTCNVKPADVGTINKPNGIGLLPDGKTLIVSDYGGTGVWAFAIQPDGALTDKRQWATMKAPEDKPTVANGDGLAVDTAGRVYVTTALGVQVFSPSGELLGILPKPKPTLVSCTFGGKDLSTLFIACGDTIYCRKTQVKGLVYNAVK